MSALTRLAFGALFALSAACGPSTRLVTVKSGGPGEIDFSVKNLTDVPVDYFYLATTDRINAAGGPKLDHNGPDGFEAWGPDLTDNGIGVGKTESIAVPKPGSWDARAVDGNGRDQFITGLKLKAGGKYVLELYESGWRVKN
jgi:hypothetical protein